MPQIIYAWNYREWGGAQIYYLSLMKEAKRSGQLSAVSGQYKVSAVIPSDSDAKILQYLSSLDVPVEFSEPAPLAVNPKGFVKKLSHRLRVYRSENRLVTAILKKLQEGHTGRQAACGPAIVHIDIGFWQSFRALSRLCKEATVFVTQHTALADPGGFRRGSWRIKGKRLSRLPNFVILASNNDAKNSLRPFLTAEKFDSIRLTYTGIDPDEIKDVIVHNEAVEAERMRSRYALSSGPLVMTVGQFIDRKGCWVVLESLRRLRDAGEQFQFVWLGTSRPADDVIERIDSYGLGDMFRLMDGDEIGATRHELLSLLNVADMFVLASFREGLPIALVEAMALGRPCIATNVGAISEAIDHDASGLLVPAGDADKLGEAITTLLHDPETRKMFGTAARAIAFEKFNQKATAEETVRIYDKVWKTNG